MKIKEFFQLIVIFLFFSGNIYSQVVIQRVLLDGNNISSIFQNTGIFNQNTGMSNSPGFEWPKNSGKFALFTTGLCIAAKIDGELAQSMASYKGEYSPGCIVNGNPYIDSNFKIYKISRGDNAGNNPDYANWYKMIPYGAPYIDVNNNHQYDPGIDSIGIRNAKQVIFLCMTDAFDSTHNIGEGFGGGIYNPKLYSQIAWTAWCYDRANLQDMQFIKWSIINRGTKTWNSTYLSIVADPDLGDPNDDYIGCDTSKKLGYCYNGDNYDPQYGTNPPAVGFILFKSPKDLCSFTFFTNPSTGTTVCEEDPIGEPNPAYLFMKGFKKDSSNFLNPIVNQKTPYTPTKFVYTGDPETSTGWTEYMGCVQNCGGNVGTLINTNPYGDRRFIMSSGDENYSVPPNDTIEIYASQLIARGNTNLSSVTMLKNYANTAWSVYRNGFSVGIEKITSIIPEKYSLHQNYPNPFNPTTNIRYQIKDSKFVIVKIFDIMGREVETLVNEKQTPGVYEVKFDGTNYPSGIYFYKLNVDVYSETKKMILLK